MSRPSPISALGTLRLSVHHSIKNNSATSVQHAHSARSAFFARSALFTAIATSLMSVSMGSALAATDVSKRAASISANTQTDNLLDALRLKKAVGQGIIDRSVLDDFNEQTLGNKNNKTNTSNNDNSAVPDSVLQQQVSEVQQRGYQMMTPEQIENELAALEILDNQDNNDAYVRPNNSNATDKNNDKSLKIQIKA